MTLRVTLATATLSAFYVVPARSAHGTLLYQTYPLAPEIAAMSASQTGTMPTVLNAKLYPANEAATKT